MIPALDSRGHSAIMIKTYDLQHLQFPGRGWYQIRFYDDGWYSWWIFRWPSIFYFYLNFAAAMDHMCYIYSSFRFILYRKTQTIFLLTICIRSQVGWTLPDFHLSLLWRIRIWLLRESTQITQSMLWPFFFWFT